ncbi:hypothetical protein EGW08_005376 [Elysia chlorotica]|uniref:MD-2-related lipid-recognition domain-containing protein n=1 Tax=Elysia chlorotica TaxID=188477 RepID=A0A433TZ33_ELYCH|nr:hypothetical protein EGW08_005376 [Elysia chlorotica]
MSVENKAASIMVLYKGRLIKVGILVFFSLLMMVLYVSFFQHPPPDELLANNRKAALSAQQLDFGATLFGTNDGPEEENDDFKDDNDDQKSVDTDVDNEDDDIEKDESETDEENKVDDEPVESEKQEVESKPRDTESDSKPVKLDANEDIISHKKRELGNVDHIEMADYWEHFLKKQNLVPIGAVYNKCEGRRVQFGTVVLMEDKENGGIKARTYVNMTLDHTVDGGQFNIDSRYNGRGLYDNYWDLCEVEDDLPDEEKTFLCPLKPGKYIRVKDKPIPSYLPKGRFQSKIWATDQNGKMIGCGFSDFTI